MPDSDEGMRILNRYRPLVDAEMRRLLAGDGPNSLYHRIRYHLGWAGADGSPTDSPGGKRVRSALCLLCCEAAGGEAAAAAPAAAAIELLHSFTLLHDDIADQDEMRRGRPTVWSLWGVGEALTAGDALYALTNLAIVNLDPAHVPSETVVRVARELNEACLTVCEGQQLDMAYEGRDDIGAAEYLTMVEGKTAALIAAACSIGGRIAAAPEEVVRALGDFGRHLGIAYQIRDDVLGLWGVEGDLGKPVGSDLKRNKRSLPIVYGLTEADPETRRELSARLAEGITTDQEAHAMAVRLEAAGARSYCDNLAEESRQRALQSLRGAPLRATPARELRALVSYLTDRSG